MSKPPSVERLEEFRNLAVEECLQAMAKFKPFNSCHEGYAVLLEEVDELWEEIKKKQSERDYDKMLKECVQVCAMSMRLAAEVVMNKTTRGHEKREA